jgi:hypothetical protein
VAALETLIHFTLGSRHLLSVPRKLVPLTFNLEDVLAGQMPEPGDAQNADGLRVLSAPLGMIDAITACFPGYVMGGRQD